MELRRHAGAWRRRVRLDAVQPDINVTPLVDVVLVLLIIFMVVTPLLQKGVPVDLPVAQDPEKKPDKKEDFIVSVKADETVWITEEDGALPPELFKARLAELYERAPSTPLYIKADKKLRYGVVKKVMLDCEASGFKSVSLVANAPAE